jgi:hypothetical protein
VQRRRPFALQVGPITGPQELSVRWVLALLEDSSDQRSGTATFAPPSSLSLSSESSSTFRTMFANRRERLELSGLQKGPIEPMPTPGKVHWASCVPRRPVPEMPRDRGAAHGGHQSQRTHSADRSFSPVTSQFRHLHQVGTSDFIVSPDSDARWIPIQSSMTYMPELIVEQCILFVGVSVPMGRLTGYGGTDPRGGRLSDLPLYE